MPNLQRSTPLQICLMGYKTMRINVHKVNDAHELCIDG